MDKRPSGMIRLREVEGEEWPGPVLVCPLAEDELRFVAKIDPVLIRQIVVRNLHVTTTAGLINSMVAGTGLEQHIWQNLHCAIRMSRALKKRMEEVTCPPYRDLFNNRGLYHTRSCPECRNDLIAIKSGIPSYPFQD